MRLAIVGPMTQIHDAERLTFRLMSRRAVQVWKAMRISSGERMHRLSTALISKTSLVMIYEPTQCSLSPVVPFNARRVSQMDRCM